MSTFQIKKDKFNEELERYEIKLEYIYADGIKNISKEMTGKEMVYEEEIAN
jgi:hypothetical protein